MAILSSFPPPSLGPPPLSVHRKGEKEENRLPPLLLPSKDRKPSFASHGGEKRERIRKLLCKYGRKGGGGGGERRPCVPFRSKRENTAFLFCGGMERFSSSRNKMPPSYLLHKTLTVGAEEGKKQRGGDRMRVVGYFPLLISFLFSSKGEKKRTGKGREKRKEGAEMGSDLSPSPLSSYFPFPPS